MKLFFLFIILHNYSCSFAQETSLIDKRRILFYSFDSTDSKLEIISKSLGRLSDTLLISDIKLITERSNGIIDTINCKYSNNSIFFTKIDSSQKDILKIYLSIKLNFSIYKKQFDERLTFPYKTIFEQTDKNSDISISFDRKKNNLYRISISKLDYPFIVSTQYLASEVLGQCNKKKRH